MLSNSSTYLIDKNFASKSFGSINNDIQTIILTYLGFSNEVKTKEDHHNLVLAEDMLGIEGLKYNCQLEYLNKLKNIVVTGLCNTHSTFDSLLIKNQYTIILDQHIEAAGNFEAARNLLANTFIYNPICQGRITHNYPINALCSKGDNIPTKRLFFPILQDFLHVQGVNVNSYDLQLDPSYSVNRLAPIHQLVMNDFHPESKESDELEILYFEELLKQGADINLKTTQSQNSVLHMAINRSRPVLLRFLVSVPNIDLFAKNADNETPLDRARHSNESKREELIEILQTAIKQSNHKGATTTLLKHTLKQTFFETPVRFINSSTTSVLQNTVGRLIWHPRS